MAAPTRIHTEEQLYAVCSKYKDVFLFFGYGERAQYADPEEVLSALTPMLANVSKPFLAVYGGDKAVLERPDLGWVMKRLQDTLGCHLLAIQSAGEPDVHVEYQFVCEQQFEEVTRTGADGQAVTVKEVLYGGTRDGKPVGGARYYLGAEFIGSKVQPGLLKTVFVMGGGGVALQEVQYADEQSVPWVYIPSRARNEDAYKSTYGPVHTWVKERMDRAAPVPLTVRGHC